MQFVPGEPLGCLRGHLLHVVGVDLEDLLRPHRPLTLTSDLPLTLTLDFLLAAPAVLQYTTVQYSNAWYFVRYVLFAGREFIQGDSGG